MTIGAFPDTFKPDPDKDALDYGTHTMPKEFWTRQGITNFIENHEALKARRKAKSARTEANKEVHAAWNRHEQGGDTRPAQPRPLGGKRYFDKHGNRRKQSSRRPN